MHFHFIEAQIHYLTPEEGGRTDSLANRHRGQFHFDSGSCMGLQYFPDLPAGKVVAPGDAVRAIVMFNRLAWEETFSKSISVGASFEIREFREVVATGTVTQLEIGTGDKKWVAEAIRAPKTPVVTPICNCGMPDRWVADRKFPVEFDEKMNEYHLVHDGAQAVMRYCFWCGGRLPESKRGTFFTEPDESELAEVHRLLEGAKSIADVIRILGTPDDTHDAGPCVPAQNASILAWKRQLDYRKRWKSLVLIVHERPDGRIQYRWGGQWKG